MTEQEFHNQRDAFAIFDDRLNWCPKGLSHYDWLVKGGLISEYIFNTELIRGYVDNTGIYFYQGDFETNDYVETVAKSWLSMFNSDLPAYCGVIKGEVGERWKPMVKIR